METKLIIIFLVAFIGSSYGAKLEVSQDFDHHEVVPSLNGGQNAVVGAFPSVVSIHTTAPLNHCGGVIVNQNHIVTSAQCVTNATHQSINPFLLRIVAGDLNVFIPTYGRFTTNVTHIYIHPNYNANNRNNDIAVIRVGNPFPFPHNTIDLAVRNIRVLPVATACQTAGWGSPTAGGQFNAVQQFVNSPILDRNACNAATAHAGSVLENMICAGTIAAGASVCTGNVGTGLFCNNELVGILSFGLSCGAINNPGVYTQIRFFNPWIEQQFTRTDQPFIN